MAAKKPSGRAEILNSIERGLPYLETEGVGWMKERKCMSCHVVPFMVWGFNEAAARGVKVDEKKLDDWTVWSVNDSLASRNWFRLAEPNAKTKIEPYPEAIQEKIKPILGKGFVAEKDLLAELGKILSTQEMKEHQALLVKRAALPPTGGQNDGGSVESISQMTLGRLTVNDRYRISLADVLERIDMATNDRDAWKERAAWSRHMSKRGYISNAQANADQAKLDAAEFVSRNLGRAGNSQGRRCQAERPSPQDRRGHAGAPDSLKERATWARRLYELGYNQVPPDAEQARLDAAELTLLKSVSELEKINPVEARMHRFLTAGTEVMLKWQEADGSWKAAGQLPSQNRPRAESNEVSTAWTLLALGSLDRPSSPVTKSIDSGLAFFRKSKPGKAMNRCSCTC